MEDSTSTNAVHEDIDSIARIINDRGFAVPAIFLLEAYKPFIRILEHSAIVSAPLAYAIAGRDNYKRLLKIIAGDNVELLISRLEEMIS